MQLLTQPVDEALVVDAHRGERGEHLRDMPRTKITMGVPRLAAKRAKQVVTAGRQIH